MPPSLAVIWMLLPQRLRHSDWFERFPFDHYKRKSADPVFLDVWLVDFFAEPDLVNNDPQCLFVLQEKNLRVEILFLT